MAEKNEAAVAAGATTPPDGAVPTGILQFVSRDIGGKNPRNILQSQWAWTDDGVQKLGFFDVPTAAAQSV